MGNCCAQEASKTSEVTKQEAAYTINAIGSEKQIPVKASPELHLEKAAQSSKVAVNAQHEQSSEFTATSLPELVLPPEIESKVRQVYPSVSKRLKEEIIPGMEFVGMNPLKRSNRDIC
jgi:hypothetical protein